MKIFEIAQSPVASVRFSRLNPDTTAASTLDRHLVAFPYSKRPRPPLRGDYSLANKPRDSLQPWLHLPASQTLRICWEIPKRGHGDRDTAKPHRADGPNNASHRVGCPRCQPQPNEHRQLTKGATGSCARPRNDRQRARALS